MTLRVELPQGLICATACHSERYSLCRGHPALAVEKAHVDRCFWTASCTTMLDPPQGRSMTCSHSFPLSPAPASQFAQWVRHLSGHRIVAQSFLWDVDDFLDLSYGVDSGWISLLGEGWPIPSIGSTYTVTHCGADVPGTLRVRLTQAGVDAVDAWLETDQLEEPVASASGNARILVLYLWGAGSGIPVGHWARPAAARRRRLRDTEWNPDIWVRHLCQRNKPSLEIRDLANRYVRLHANQDEALRLNYPIVGISPKALSLLLHAMASRPVPLVEFTRRAATKPGLGHFLTLEAHDWIAPRQLAAAGTPELNERERRFLSRVANRSAVRRSAPPSTPLSRAKQCQLESLKVTQAAIGSILREHRGGADLTATGWSVRPFYVYRDDHVYGGWPTSLDVISSAHAQHPMIQSTQRILDGAVWLPDDRVDQPSIWIEHEAGRTHLRSHHHLAAALACSSRWDRMIDLVFIASAEARPAVEDQLSAFLRSGYYGRCQTTEFPGAHVRVAVISEATARTGCPLHGPASWNEVLQIAGNPLRWHSLK